MDRFFKPQLNTLIIICFLICFTSKAQTSKTPINDFSVVLHEETLNKVFTAIGDIKGSSDFEVMLIKGKYYWTVQKARIAIRPDSSQFYCDALVEVGSIKYKTPVKGDVKITYDQKKNEIAIKITRAIFELYTTIFGKKIHIKDIDIADNFKDPFIFEGPATMGTDFEFMMPDSTMKKIYMQPSTCTMEIQHKQIVTQCEVAVQDKPFKPATPAPTPKKDAVVTPAAGTTPEKKK